MHVLVHEIQNGEPEGSKGGQGKQRREVLKENLEKGKHGRVKPLEKLLSVNLSKLGSSL